MSAAAPTLAVLMALRVKGRAGSSSLAAATGLSEVVVREVLAAAAARGAVGGATRTAVGTTTRAGVGRGMPADAVTLTPAGRDELRALLAAESIDRAALAAAYGEFLAVDTTLKRRITAWQLLPPERRTAGARAALAADGAHAGALAERLARIVPRLEPYARRLVAACGTLAGGDERFVAHPAVDSLHQVWFELHEDLLATLGRARTS